MITAQRKNGAIFLLLMAGGLASLAAASQQVDPFYLRLFEKAQKSFLAKNYADAAQDLEIAAFGLDQDSALQAKAYFFLGLSHYYLKNIDKSEGFLRQGADLLGDRNVAALGIPEHVFPELERLLTFFDIQVALPELRVEPPPVQAQNEAPPKSPPPAEKEPDKVVRADPDGKPPAAVDKIREGDIVDLDLVDELPVATRRVAAIYPSSLSGTRVTGTVIVNALVSEKGNVIKAEVLEEVKGAPGLNQAALNAVRRWKFEPAMIKGIKVKVWMPISIVFKKQE